MNKLKEYCKALISEFFTWLTAGIGVVMFGLFELVIKLKKIELTSTQEQIITAIIVALTFLVAPFMAWKKLYNKISEIEKKHPQG